MKKLFLFAMVAAALSGCSNSDEVDTNPEVQPGGEGYVGFSIQLPTVPGTRANDVFDDGTPQPDEYRVYNATLFIFKGDDETSATYESAYKMNVMYNRGNSLFQGYEAHTDRFPETICIRYHQ